MTDYETKRELFIETLTALKAARARVAEINASLPDELDTKKRAALKAERARLTTDIETAPDEIAELARLTALADLARIKAGIEEAQQKLDTCEPKLEVAYTDIRKFDATKRQATLLDPFGRHHPGGGLARSKEWGIEGVKLDSFTPPLEREVAGLKAEIGGLEARVMQNYPKADVSRPTTWPRPAHDFGEAWRKAAQTGDYE